MLTREIAINQATNFILECLKYGISIEKAILFGSIAKNEQRETSDIDIALISSAFTKNFIYNNRLTSMINIKFPLIEVHHFNSDYFKKGDPFINEIITNGYEIKWKENSLVALKEAIQEGIDSGIACNFNPESHLEELKEQTFSK